MTSIKIQILIFCLFLSQVTFADGCFVTPKHVWKGYKNLREPGQKAIIVFEDGVEHLILQVKFEGDIDKFGWLIPLPSLPEAKKVTFSSFPPLDNNCGKKFYTTPLDEFKYDKKYQTFLKKVQLLNAEKSYPKNSVQILSDKQVGIYKITVLKADDGSSLNQWLEKNNFKVPDGGEKVLDSYIKKNWYFTAMKVNTGFDKQVYEKKRQHGELPPIHLIFKTEKPFYPLHISSINKGSSTILIYLFARNAYAHKIFAPEKIEMISAEKYFQNILSNTGYQYFITPSSEKYAERLYDVLHPPNIEPVVFYKWDSSLPALQYEVPVFSAEWICSYMKKKISSDKMLEDLIFDNKYEFIKSIVDKTIELENDLGYEIKNRQRLPEAMRKRKPFKIPLLKKEEEKNPLLVKNLKERKKNIYNFLEKSPIIPKISFYPFIRPLALEILKKPSIKVADEFIMEYEFNYFSPPNKSDDDQKISPFYDKISTSFRNEKSIMRFSDKLNSVSDKAQQMLLSYFYIYRDPGMFEFLSTWLSDDDVHVRSLALKLLARSIDNTIKDCGGDKFGFTVRPYICESVFYEKEKNLQKIRPLLKDKNHLCRYGAAWILAMMADEKSIPFFIDSIMKAEKVRKPRINNLPLEMQRQMNLKLRKHYLSELALLAMVKLRSPLYTETLVKLLEKCKASYDSAINYRQLIETAVLYQVNPKIRKRLVVIKSLLKSKIDKTGKKNLIYDIISSGLEQKNKSNKN